MMQFTAARPLQSVLLLGAHSDDIEIGCGGTVLRLLEEHPNAALQWHVFGGADAARADEARRSATELLGKAVERAAIQLHDFRDAFMPYHGAAVKEVFERIKHQCKPDLIFTHYRADAHQDHRLLSELARNTFRDHTILEYEIPKYDGDTWQPNVYFPLTEGQVRRKIEHLTAHFPTQAGRQWYDADTFRATLRIRGIEANSPTRFAEGFYCHKMVL